MESVAERVVAERGLELGTRAHSLECSSCCYGIARTTPPERCPMCQAVDEWIAPARRSMRERPAD